MRFLLSMLLATLLAIGGLFEILTGSGRVLLGILLMFASVGLGGHAKTAKAARLHRRRLAGNWQWAQGMGRLKDGRERRWRR